MAISRRRSTSEPRSSFECDAAPSTSTWRMTPYRSTNLSRSTLAFPKVGIIMKIMATESKLMLYMYVACHSNGAMLSLAELFIAAFDNTVIHSHVAFTVVVPLK